LTDCKPKKTKHHSLESVCSYSRKLNLSCSKISWFPFIICELLGICLVSQDLRFRRLRCNPPKSRFAAEKKAQREPKTLN